MSEEAGVDSKRTIITSAILVILVIAAAVFAWQGYQEAQERQRIRDMAPASAETVPSADLN